MHWVVIIFYSWTFAWALMIFNRETDLCKWTEIQVSTGLKLVFCAPITELWKHWELVSVYPNKCEMMNFYINCRNSRTLIGWFSLFICWICRHSIFFHLCDVDATRESLSCGKNVGTDEIVLCPRLSSNNGRCTDM